MQYAQVDVQTKEASNLTRKELEEIASGIYEVAKVEEDEQTEGLSKLDDQSKEES